MSFLCLLINWEFHILYFDHIYPLFPSSSKVPHYHIPTNFSCLWFFRKKSGPICAIYVCLGCIINLPEAMPLKKPNCPTSSSSLARSGLHIHISSPYWACFLFWRLPLHSHVAILCWMDAFLVSWGSICCWSKCPCIMVLLQKSFPVNMDEVYFLHSPLPDSEYQVLCWGPWIWSWVMFRFHSSSWSCPVWLALFVADDVFSILYVAGFFVKNQVALGAWPSMCVLNYILLINEPVFMPVSC